MHAHHRRHRGAPSPAFPAVLVDGVEIPAAEIAAEMQHHPAASAESAWHQAAEALVVRRLLLDEAARRGHAPAPGEGETAEEAAIRGLLDAAIAVPEADEATCRRWYEANRSRFRSPEAWHAAHILVAADPADAPAREPARARAGALRAEVAAAPERLAELAARHSDCPSREQGGDLGLVTPGSTVPEFEAALSALRPGEVAPGPVESRYGFHVVRLLDRAPGRDIPFDLARERVAEYLREASFRRAVRQYLSVLAGRAEIVGIALSAAADGPLVQ